MLMNSASQTYDRCKAEDEPIPLSGHVICVSDFSDSVYLIGGYNPHPPNVDPNEQLAETEAFYREVWRFNTVTRQWKIVKQTNNGPLTMASHSAVSLCNEREEAILFFGGSQSILGLAGNSNITWILRINLATSECTWEQLNCSGSKPPQANGHWFGSAACLVENEISRFLYVSTGVDGFLRNRFSRTYLHQLDLETRIWSEIGAESEIHPPCCVRHEMVHHKGKIFLLGGSSEFLGLTYDLDKLWCYDLQSPKNQWTLVTTIAADGQYPHGRTCFSCVYFEGKAYIYGGMHQNETGMTMLNDLWQLNLDSLVWKKLRNLVTVPKAQNVIGSRARYFHSAAVTSNGTMYVFGGCMLTNYMWPNVRTNEILVVRLPVPRLFTLCWDVIMANYGRRLVKCPTEDLICAGFAIPFINRLQRCKF